MALTTYTHAPASNTAWNLPATWGLVSGFPNSNEALISLSGITASISASIGDNITAGKIIVGNNTLGVTLQVSTTSGKILTLDPVNYGGIAVEIPDVPLAASSRLLFYPPVQFLSDSELKVSSLWQLRFTASSGVSGNVNIRKTGGGLLWLDAASPSLGSSGKTFTIEAGSVQTYDAGALGSADMAVVVQSGAVLWPSGGAAVQKSITISGSGNLTDTAQFKCYGAFLAEFAPLAATVFTIQGTNATYTQTYTGACVSKFTGTVSGEFELNSTANGGNAALTNAANDYVATGGVRVSSKYYPTGAKYTGFVLADNDKTFGATSNNVIVDATGRIRFDTSAVTARNYTFDGAAATGGQVDQVFTTTFSPRFTGDITVNGKTEFTSSSTATTTYAYSIEGNLSGAGNIVVSSTLDLKGDISGYTGVFQCATAKVIILHNSCPISLYITSATFYLEKASDSPSTITLSSTVGWDVQDDLVIRNSTGKIVLDLPLRISATGNFNLASAVEVEFKKPMSKMGSYSQLGLYGAAGCTYTLSSTITDNSTFTDVDNEFGGGTININHAGALGTSATGTGNYYIRNSSTVAALQISPVSIDTTVTGGITLIANCNLYTTPRFTWVGSNDLTFPGSFGSASLAAPNTYGMDFLNGKTGTLRFIGGIANGLGLSIGGTPAGGSRARFRIDGPAATTAASSVTAGYFQINNANGLGTVGAAITWTVSNGAALEIGSGIVIPVNKTLSVIGLGPNLDGCLRGVNSGGNFINGPISIPASSPVLPTRFKADTGDLTLENTGLLTVGAATTPLYLDASATKTLSVKRAVPSNVGLLTVNTAGTSSTGTVVLSVANSFAGGLSVEGGLCKALAAGAISTGAVAVKSNATLKTAFTGGKATFSAGLTFGTTGETAPAVLHIGGT